MIDDVAYIQKRNGRWQAAYRGPDKRERTRTFDRRVDAERWLDLNGADMALGAWIDPRAGRVTVSAFASSWLARRVDLAETTTVLYRYLLEDHIVPALGDVRVASLAPSMVAAWHAKLASEHRTTAAKAYRLLSQIMRAAVADRLMSQNPCQVRGAAVEKAPERPMASVAEVEALAAAMPQHLRAVVLLAAWCQLRRGEILGLRRRDIDLLHGTLVVTLTRTKTMAGATIVKAPKTEAGKRTIAIPSNIVAALKAHLDSNVRPDPESPVIVGEKGGPIGPQVLTTAWSKARTSVGRPDLHLHDLRHTGLTWSAATGATTRELMRRGGHKSPAAALRYQHATEDRDRVIADALAGLTTPTPVVNLADISRTRQATGD